MVRHLFRIVSLGPRQRGGASTVFLCWNDILFVCARALSWSVRGNHPSKKSSFYQVCFRVVQFFFCAIVILIALFVSFKKFVLTFSILHFLFLSLSGKMSVSATTRESPRADLRVLRCASSRVCGRRSFQYTWDS